MKEHPVTPPPPPDSCRTDSPVAAARDVAPSIPLLHLRPPYRGMELRIGAASIDRAEIGPGSVLLLRSAPPLDSWELCADIIQSIRTRIPQVPVVLLVDPFSTRGYGALPVELGRRARVCIHGGDDLGSVLRRRLTCPDAIGPEVLDWLEVRGLALSPVAGLAVREIFDRAPSHSQMFDLCAELGVSLTAVVESFAAERLPHPGLWLETARVLHAVLRIQARRGSPVEPLVREVGFSAASTLGSQLYRTFRCRTSVVRDTLGWEWLLDRWISQRVSLSARRRVA